MNRENQAVFIILRLGLVFAFLYAAWSAHQNPSSWVGYFPQTILKIFGRNEALMMNTFGIFEVLLSIWILSGALAFWANGIATILPLVIVVSNWGGAADVVFRDISIAAMSLALAVESFPLRKTGLT